MLKHSWLASGGEHSTGAWGGVRCSSSHSAPGRQRGPEPSLPVPAVPSSSPPLLLHHKCRTPRLVKKIRVKLKPLWHMGLFKLATAWLSPSVAGSTAVMPLVASSQHNKSNKRSSLEVLPKSEVPTGPPAFWWSCCHRAMQNGLCHSTASSCRQAGTHAPEHL